MILYKRASPWFHPSSVYSRSCRLSYSVQDLWGQVVSYTVFLWHFPCSVQRWKIQCILFSLAFRLFTFMVYGIIHVFCQKIYFYLKKYIYHNFEYRIRHTKDNNLKCARYPNTTCLNMSFSCSTQERYSNTVFAISASSDGIEKPTREIHLKTDRVAFLKTKK